MNILERLARWLDGSLVTDHGGDLPFTPPMRLSPDVIIDLHLRRLGFDHCPACCPAGCDDLHRDACLHQPGGAA
jgi:hypothetical protein